MWRSVAGNIGKWVFLKGVTYADWIDRLNYHWTFLLLLSLSILSGWRRYAHPPLSCWCPAQFSPAMVSYANEICWLQHSVHLPFDGRADPSNRSSRTPFTIYQWIPIILALQALCFKIPHIIWHLLHGFSGVTFAKLSGLTEGAEMQTTEERNITSRTIARYLERWLKSALIPALPWRSLTFLYLLTKALLCINATLQLVYIDSILVAKNESSFGQTMFTNLVHRNETIWKSPQNFPPIMLCNYEIRRFTNVYEYTVQCTVSMKLFYEQIYVLLWAWLVSVCVLTWLSLLVLVLTALLPMTRTRFLQNYLDISDEPACWGQAPSLYAFANSVGHDGVMVLDAISQTSSEFMVRDIVVHLWRINHGGQPVQSGYSTTQPRSGQLGRVISLPQHQGDPLRPASQTLPQQID